MPTAHFEALTEDELGPPLTRPTAADLAEARRTIADVIPLTPTVRAFALEAQTGATVYLKLDTFAPLNVFKNRSALNVVRHLAPEVKQRGIVCASTGNFGQSIAWAARQDGVPATIFVPVGANPTKVARIREQGAEVVEIGKDFDEARLQAGLFAAERGYYYSHSANDAVLIAGAGTHAAELLDEVPDLDVIYVPAGGGSGAAGVCLARDAAGSAARVIAVQSAAAPALRESWAQGVALKSDLMATRAEGLATRSAFRLTLELLRDGLADFLLVDDDALTAAAATLLQTSRVLCEEAGAAGLAGFLAQAGTLSGKKVGVIVSGGNPSPEAVRRIVDLAFA